MRLIPSACRPDMPFAVDWALKNNYLSIYPQCRTHALHACFKQLPSGRKWQSTRVLRNFYKYSFIPSAAKLLSNP